MSSYSQVKLPPRLQMLADMVRRGSAVADIGTDHGYLPLYLVQKGIAKRVIASDVRLKPLENAKKNLEPFCAEGLAEVRLSDGLDAFERGEVQDIILAGMGGDLIVNILARTEWIKDNGVRLIIQPMTRPETVRAFLCSYGFKILFESACTEAQRAYIAMCAVFDGDNEHKGDFVYSYLGELLSCNTEAARHYLNKLRKRLNIREHALKATGNNEAEAAGLSGVIAGITEILQDE